MITTLTVEKADLERFMHDKLDHQAEVGKELNHAEFFKLVMDAWKKYLEWRKFHTEV
jgi:hypothetical protein